MTKDQTGKRKKMRWPPQLVVVGDLCQLPRPACFETGQLYVALSRVREAGDLHLVRPLQPSYLRFDPAVEAFHQEVWQQCRDWPDGDRATRRPSWPEVRGSIETRRAAATLGQAGLLWSVLGFGFCLR